MITEFNFPDEEGGTISNVWLTFYVEDFPIDLKKGDEICFEEFGIPEATVTSLRYGLQNGNVVKILTLIAT